MDAIRSRDSERNPSQRLFPYQHLERLRTAIISFFVANSRHVHRCVVFPKIISSGHGSVSHCVNGHRRENIETLDSSP